MDTGRLPTYRSSYLLRFHPYPRVKASTRERIMASTGENEPYEPLHMNSLLVEGNVLFALDQAIHGSDVRAQLRQRRLSVSSLVVDLAFLLEKKSSL